jgi:hypothetical protein
MQDLQGASIQRKIQLTKDLQKIRRAMNGRFPSWTSWVRIPSPAFASSSKLVLRENAPNQVEEGKEKAFGFGADGVLLDPWRSNTICKFNGDPHRVLASPSPFRVLIPFRSPISFAGSPRRRQVREQVRINGRQDRRRYWVADDHRRRRQRRGRRLRRVQ